MSLDNHLMFEAFGTFRPVENYADNGYHFTFNYGRDQKAYVGIFITLILAENRLRATVQRGEYVSTKIRELSGFNTIRAVKFNFKKKLLVSSRLEKLTKELHDLQKERWIQTQELFT